MIPDNLITRWTIPIITPPIRAYVHSYGLEAYSDEGPLYHLKSTVEKNSKKFDHYDLLFSILWGDNTDKMIDFFGFKLPKNKWPGNPDIEAMVFKNGVHQPKEKENNFKRNY